MFNICKGILFVFLFALIRFLD